MPNFKEAITGSGAIIVCCGLDMDAEERDISRAFPYPFKRWTSWTELRLHNSIIAISWLITIDLKQIYCSYSRTQKIQNGVP